MQIIEPLRQDKKLVSYLTDEIKKVGIVFFHGLGDCVQFKYVFEYLKEKYLNIHFDILLQKGLDQQTIFPDGIELDSLDKIKEMKDYDYIFLVHFPVEQDPKLTKTELCAKEEIGINMYSKYDKLLSFGSPLVGVHFQNTALPDIFNPSEKIAKKIWQEVIDCGLIPIELSFKHAYHNPVNKKFDFINCTVRDVWALVPSLIGLIQRCKAVIAIPSGPLHCALAIMPERVFYLEKDIPINRFIHTEIPSVNIKDDKFEEGKIKQWLNMLT